MYSRFGRFRHFNCAPLQLHLAQRNQPIRLLGRIAVDSRPGRAGPVAGGATSVRLFDVHLGSVDAAGHRPVHVPEGTLLRVEHLSLELVPFLIHLALRLGLKTE